MITIDKRIINDLPIGNLDDHLFRRAMQMLVIADINGVLPESKDLPFLLRTNEKDIEKSIIELTRVGYLQKYHGYIEEYFGAKSDKMQIIGFEKYLVSVTEKRDEPSRKLSDAERSKRYREKQKASRKENENKVNNINNNINNKNNLKENTLFEISNEISNVDNTTSTEKSDESDESSQTSERIKPDFSWAKEEEQRAYEFWLYSDIYPTKTEYGRWIKELRQFTEAGISIPAMRAAINELKSKHFHIGAPGSVFKTARSISTQDAVEAPMSNEEIIDLLDYSELGDI